jgi:hypothetical protein
MMKGRPWLDEKLFRIAMEDVLFSTTLESLHANIPQAIEAVVGILGQECTQDGEPFPRLYNQIYENYFLASGIALACHLLNRMLDLCRPQSYLGL